MILQEIRNSIVNNLNISEEQLVIRGLWPVDCLFKPNRNERTFNYKFIVAQTIGQGAAYSMEHNYKMEYLESLMGKNYLDLELKSNDTALEIAILDAIYSTLQDKPDQKVELNGTSVAKAEERANVIAEEAIRLIDRSTSKSELPLICNIGVVGNIIKELIDKDVQVIGTDFDDELVGKKLFGEVEIVHGNYNPDIIKKSDVAVITGMTLTTGTLDEIIDVAKRYNTKIVMFAETGSNLGSFYVKNGIDCVVGEPFPFYIFQGKTTLNIFRKKQNPRS